MNGRRVPDHAQVGQDQDLGHVGMEVLEIQDVKATKVNENCATVKSVLVC